MGIFGGKMELYREMMNQGFVIFESDTKFVLDKINTPANQTLISGGESWMFDSFEDALKRVKVLISWKEPEQPKTANVQTALTTWQMHMMYHHKGMGTKFVDLGELGSISYQTAVDEAKKRADSYIVQSDLEKQIEGYEVKVRPRQ